LPGGDEIQIAFQQSDAIFELLQPPFETQPELVVHLSLYLQLGVK
jgi:hypothetical protein